MSDFVDARARMILGQVRTNDVQDVALIAAMSSLPREAYVAPDQAHLAYSDLCVSLKPGRHLLDPRSLAKMIQAAGISADDRVLDIASGTGYSTAVLCQLSRDVVTLEEDPELVARAQIVLAKTPKLGSLFGATGPHKAGWAQHAPYDVILVNGAVPSPAEAWGAQLKPGGRMIAFTTNGPVGRARLYVSDGGKVGGRDIFDAMVPTLPGFAQARAFAF